jgi:hypothetical protein
VRDDWRLQGVAGPQRQAACGCVLVHALERLIDGRGCFIRLPTLVLVPCAYGDEHVEAMRAVCREDTGSGDLDEIVSRFDHAVANGQG